MYFVFLCMAGLDTATVRMRCSRGYFYIEGNLNMGATDDDGCTSALGVREWSGSLMAS
jgi:hypothetical protein